MYPKKEALAVQDVAELPSGESQRRPTQGFVVCSEWLKSVKSKLKYVILCVGFEVYKDVNAVLHVPSGEWHEREQGRPFMEYIAKEVRMYMCTFFFPLFYLYRTSNKKTKQTKKNHLQDIPRGDEIITEYGDYFENPKR